MTASEQKRFELREGLIDLLGQDKAETLMEALPPVSWDQLATKDDLNTLVVVIGAEFTKVASEFTAVRGELTAVRGEFAAVRGELTAVRGEFTEQIGEVHKEIGEVHKEIGEVHKEIGEVHKEIAKSSEQSTAQFVELSDKITDQSRVNFRWMVATVVTVVGAVVGSGIWIG